MRANRISIFIVTVILVCIGIVMVYSASGAYAMERYGDSAYFLKRHLVALLFTVIFGFLVMTQDLEKIRKNSHWWLALAVFFLLLVLLPGLGSLVYGVRRWIRLGIFNFQPSEMAKLAVIIYLSDFLARKKKEIQDFMHTILPALLIMGLVAGLILLQPDLGMAVGIFSVALILLFVAGMRLSHIGFLLLGSLPLFFLLIFSVGYRKQRIFAFLNPWADPKGAGYQVIQSLLALGSGGLIGVGLGHSRQKLFYLPANHTDFIFSIIGEETGFLGALTVIILFLILLWQGIEVCLNAQDDFRRYLSLGITAMLAFSALVNIGVATAAIPTKGLPLPFISYGGSALVFNLIGIALLLNAAKTQK
jgi:cell division protein FtsW